MPDMEVLQEALSHVDHAASALAGAGTAGGRAAALAELDEAHELLSAIAYASAVGADRDGPQHRATSRPTAGTASRAQDGVTEVRAPLDRDVRAVRAARASCTRACGAWGLSPEAAATAADLAGELVSNAVRHACGTIEMTLVRHADHVRVIVSDGSCEPPRRLPYRPGVSDRGIGLRLVEHLSTSWGWASVPGGKQVWACAAIPAPPAA